MKNIISNDELNTAAISMYVTAKNDGFEIRLIKISRRHVSPQTRRTPI